MRGLMRKLTYPSAALAAALQGCVCRRGRGDRARDRRLRQRLHPAQHRRGGDGQRRRRASRGGGDRARGAGPAERQDELDARPTGCGRRDRRSGSAGKVEAHPRLRRPSQLGLRRARHDAQGAGRRRRAGRVDLRGPRRLRHLGDDGRGHAASSASSDRGRGHRRASTCPEPSTSPVRPGSTRRASPADLHTSEGYQGREERSPRGPLPGQGDRRHDARHAGHRAARIGSRSAASDGRVSWGPAAAARRAAGRLTRAKARY